MSRSIAAAILVGLMAHPAFAASTGTVLHVGARVLPVVPPATTAPDTKPAATTAHDGGHR